ncbi:hypothetical protein YC2023_046021 [Brassica napus]
MKRNQRRERSTIIPSSGGRGSGGGEAYGGGGVYSGIVMEVMVVKEMKDISVMVKEIVMDSPQFEIGFMTTLSLTT